MKRIFGVAEAVFDGGYLASAFTMAAVLLITAGADPVRRLAGIMSLVLAAGDCFHLVPRIAVMIGRGEHTHRVALGRGKQITSITMTVFYVLLWHIGLLLFPANGSWLIYGLAALRIVLCLLPQNRWQEVSPPVTWGIVRNVPFFLQGLLVAALFFQNRNAVPQLSLMWLAILLSFACYLPVVLWSGRNRKIGMLMLPKTCMYLWMLAMLYGYHVS